MSSVRFMFRSGNVLASLDMELSLAYMPVSLFLMAFGKSSINKMKNKGPSIDTWGTIVSIGSFSDRFPLNLVHCNLYNVFTFNKNVF